MDFNMWMQDGIPYVTGETARYLMTKFEERYEKKREDEGKKESPTKKKPVRSFLVPASNNDTLHICTLDKRSSNIPSYKIVKL